MDGGVKVIIMLSQLLDVAIVEARAELDDMKIRDYGLNIQLEKYPQF